MHRRGICTGIPQRFEAVPFSAIVSKILRRSRADGRHSCAKFRQVLPLGNRARPYQGSGPRQTGRPSRRHFGPHASGVGADTLAHDGSPPITRTTIPTCRAHYPGGSSGCACRLLPHSCSLPPLAGGSASALSLSRPAQALHMLRPTGSLSRPRRPLSRGSSPSGHPAEPLVSYQINRQFSGWILPPQVICAFGAHCQFRTKGS